MLNMRVRTPSTLGLLPMEFRWNRHVWLNGPSLLNTSPDLIRRWADRNLDIVKTRGVRIRKIIHTGYLPSRRALPPHLGRFSFTVPPRVGGWVGLTGRLHTKTVYPSVVTLLSTNRDQRRATSWMRPMPLLLGQIAISVNRITQKVTGKYSWSLQRVILRKKKQLIIFRDTQATDPVPKMLLYLRPLFLRSILCTNKNSIWRRFEAFECFLVLDPHRQLGVAN